MHPWFSLLHRGQKRRKRGAPYKYKWGPSPSASTFFLFRILCSLFSITIDTLTFGSSILVTLSLSFSVLRSTFSPSTFHLHFFTSTSAVQLQLQPSTSTFSFDLHIHTLITTLEVITLTKKKHFVVDSFPSTTFFANISKPFSTATFTHLTKCLHLLNQRHTQVEH